MHLLFLQLMGLAHVCRQEPQFLESVLVFVSQPFSGLPSQSARSVEHIVPPEPALLLPTPVPTLTFGPLAELVMSPLLTLLGPLVVSALVAIAPAPP